MIDGIYSMTFRGAVSWGTGLLVLRRGVVTGADTTGIIFDGSFSEQEGHLQIRMEMVVPPGVQLVQGTPARATEYRIPFAATIPTVALQNNTPVLVNLPPGPVNIIFRQLRGLVD